MVECGLFKDGPEVKKKISINTGNQIGNEKTVPIVGNVSRYTQGTSDELQGRKSSSRLSCRPHPCVEGKHPSWHEYISSTPPISLQRHLYKKKHVLVVLFRYFPHRCSSYLGRFMALLVSIIICN